MNEFFSTVFQEYISNEYPGDMKLDFTDPSIVYTRLAYNWYLLKQKTEDHIYFELLRVYRDILSTKNNLISIIVVGSVARGFSYPESDVDLVVIVDTRDTADKLQYNSSYKDVNIVYRTKNEFLRNYKKGYEFFVWSVRYGLPLYDNNFFFKLYMEPISVIFKEEILFKRTYINKTVKNVYESITNSDLVLAISLIKKIAIQIGRIIIITKNIIPKSRPELEQQLFSIDTNFYMLYIQLKELSAMSKQQLTDYTESIYSYLNDYLQAYYQTNES